MNKKLITKLIAAMLTITLTFANVLLLGNYVAKAYATDSDLENQGVATNNPNVEFDAYYVKNQTTAHSVVADMNAEELKLALYVKVKKGYLKTIKVSVSGEEKEANFNLSDNKEDMSLIESIHSEKNEVNLKQINQDSQVIVQIPILANKDNQFELTNFNKQNNITMEASYVNDDGKEIAIKKTVRTNLEWTAEAKASLEQQVLKNKIYTMNQERKLLLQTLVQTGLENNALPIEKTQIQIQVPTIEGIKPEEVKVIAKQTMGTNGKSGIEFEEENWKYNEESGLLGIITKNENIDNEISWNKEQKDQYVITYIFPEEAIQKIQQQQEMKIKQDIDLKISTYGSTTKEVAQTGSLEINVKEEQGEILTSLLKGSMPKFSKGYLYSKIDQETLYTIENDVQIELTDIVDQILINNKEDKFMLGEQEIATANDTYFKSTKINKEMFNKLLGEEGYIKILNQDGTVLGNINKETAVDENQNYIYIYEGKNTEIILETSKPIVEGELKLQHEKAITTNTKYTNEEIAAFEKFRTSASVQLKNKNENIAYIEKAIYAELIEPETKIEAEISNGTLSTVVKNENVQIKTILLTNDDSCMLYKNPVIEMEFPSFIENIELREAPQIMYDDALKVKSYEIYNNAAGNKVLRIIITGEDTTYSFDNISKGANIIVNADMTLKKLTPTTDSEINIVVKNENGQTRTRSTSTTTTTKLGVKALAPVAMVTTTTVTGYNSRNETIYSINAQEQTAKLNARAQARTAKIEMDIINNYNNVAKNISILGRIPNGEVASLKTAITQTGIDASKVTIYYSQNENATKDLNLQANGWTTEADNLAKAKSYLVVIAADYEMQTGTKIKLVYEIDIAQGLNYNVSTQAGYTVYFDNVKEEQTIQDSATAANIIFTTGEGPELATTIKADVAEGQEVQEGSVVKYTATVKNNGKSRVENVKLAVNIPYKAVYFRYEGEAGTQEGIQKVYDEDLVEYSQTFDIIEPEETKTIEFLVEVGSLTVTNESNHITDENGNTTMTTEQVIEEAYLEVKARAIVEGYEARFYSNVLKNRIIQGYLNITLDTEPVPANIVRAEGETVEYVANIINVNSVQKKNAVAKLVVPEGYSFSKANRSGYYDEGTRTIIWNLGTIRENQPISLVFKLKVDKLPDNQYERTLTTKLTVTTKDKEVSSNELTIDVKKSALAVNLTSSTTGNVSVGGTIDYNVVVENIGKGTATNVKLTDALPRGLEYKKAQYAYNGKVYESAIGGKKAVVTLPTINEGEKVEINIKVVAAELRKDETQLGVTNKVKVTANGIEEVESNEISHTIVVKNSANDPTTDGDTVEGTYTVSGVAWLDSNKDGKRDAQETLLSNIQVVLINADNGQIVQDIKTNQKKIQYTNGEGQYVFANLKPGKYIVVYFYDTDNYAVTAYQKEGVLDSNNSDAISMKVTYEGKERQAAATNAIQITNSNITNIDIGLITKEKFNLSLDKTITKITASNTKGTKTYDYNNTKLAKLDLNSKYMNSTNIIIEYKITVSNIGAIPGYVKKIVDYIPKDMKFNSEMNADWYVSDNGNAYNASLANTVLQPGETKEVKLVLTKKMTENNTGTINNRAEIYEAYNDYGIADEDSTPANKVSGENDMSSADAIIGVNTGEIMIYITITLISIGILGVGIYLINKKVLRKI